MKPSGYDIRQQYQEFTEKFNDIRERLLTEDEKIVLQMKLEGKTDSQIAEILKVTVSAANQRKFALYNVIAGLVWWETNKERVLTHLRSGLNPKMVEIFEKVAERKKQSQIASEMNLSVWRINKMMAAVMEKLSTEEEFRIFMEKLHTGYHLPWKERKVKKSKTEETIASQTQTESAIPQTQEPASPPTETQESTQEPEKKEEGSSEQGDKPPVL